MSAISDFLEAEYVKYAFTAEAMGTRPTAWYVALHTADPTDTGTVGEVTGSSYARTAVAWTRTANQVANTAAITFPAVTSTGYTVSHVSIWTAASGGNCLFRGALALSKALAVGEAANFAASELILNVS